MKNEDTLVDSNVTPALVLHAQKEWKRNVYAEKTLYPMLNVETWSQTVAKSAIWNSHVVTTAGKCVMTMTNSSNQVKLMAAVE